MFFSFYTYSADSDDEPTMPLSVPYKNRQGEKIMASLKKTLRNAGCEARIIYRSAKLQSLFSVKDKTKF